MLRHVIFVAFCVSHPTRKWGKKNMENIISHVSFGGTHPFWCPKIEGIESSHAQIYCGVPHVVLRECGAILFGSMIPSPRFQLNYFHLRQNAWCCDSYLLPYTMHLFVCMWWFKPLWFRWSCCFDFKPQVWLVLTKRARRLWYWVGSKPFPHAPIVWMFVMDSKL